jgi:hypothetical protein
MLKYEGPKLGVYETRRYNEHGYEHFTIRVGEMRRGPLAEEALAARANRQGWGASMSTPERAYQPNATSESMAELYERLYAGGARWFYDHSEWSHAWQFQLYSGADGSYCEPHIELTSETNRWRKLGDVAKLTARIGKRAGGRGYDMHPSHVLRALEEMKFHQVYHCWEPGRGPSAWIECPKDVGHEPRMPAETPPLAIVSA